MKPPGGDRTCPAYQPTGDLIVGRLVGEDHPAVIVGERPTRKWDGHPGSLLASAGFRRLAHMVFRDSVNPIGTYLRTFERVNAIQQPGVRLTKVLSAASGLAIRCLAGRRPVVVCGRVAERVLGLGVGDVPRRMGQFLVIPHPSGLSRAWNDRKSAEKIVQAVRYVLGLQS
jgi:uracil-DNA glycosylase